jgi:cation diffusion facilitator family transporter
MAERAQPSRRTVIVALLMNAGVTVAKLVAALLTGSSGLLAESVHSLADTANQGLLWASIGSARRPPDDTHPFGYGRDRFFWSLVAAIAIFVGGSAVALGEGVLGVVGGPGEPQVGHLPVAFAVLAVSGLLDGISFRVALADVRGRARRAGMGLVDFARTSTDPTVKTVLFEDAADLTGVLIAALGLVGHQLTGDARWDGLAAILIGALLIGASVILARESRSLLLGEGATPEEREVIARVIAADPAIVDVVSVRSTHQAPQTLFVIAGVHVRSDLPASELATVTERLEREIARYVPDLSGLVLDVRPTSAGSAPEHEPAAGTHGAIRHTSR